MAISIRGGAPAIGTSTTQTVSTACNGSKQPQSGDLLLIFHGNDWNDLAEMPTPTVGGSSTGVQSITNGVADGGSDGNHVKSYYWVAASSGDQTVAVTETGTVDGDRALVVYVLSGADTASPVDGGASGAAGSFSITGQATNVVTGVTPSGSDAVVFVHLHTNAGGASPYTPPSSPWVEDYDASMGAFGSYTGGHEQLAASGATGSRTFTPASSSTWAAVMVAIKTGSAAAPTYAMLRPAVVAP